MTIEADDCEQIYDYTLEQWQPLLDLIPLIEQKLALKKKSGELVVEDSTNTPAYSPSQIVHQFRETVYSIPIMIAFDWSAWDDGREMTGPDFNLDSVDLVDKCRLITAIVRNDRFCEGALMSHFESGLILRILKSIEDEVRK